MENQQLIQRIESLEREIQNLKSSSSIPYEIDNAFNNRGFLKSNSLMYAGRTQAGIAGVARIPIPGATAESVAYVTYTTFPAPGIPVGYIEFATDHYELHIDSDYGVDVDFIVFLNNTGNFIDLT